MVDAVLCTVPDFYKIFFPNWFHESPGLSVLGSHKCHYGTSEKPLTSSHYHWYRAYQHVISHGQPYKTLCGTFQHILSHLAKLQSTSHRCHVPGTPPTHCTGAGAGWKGSFLIISPLNATRMHPFYMESPENIRHVPGSLILKQNQLFRKYLYFWL